MSYNDSSQRSRGPSGGPSEVKPSPNLRPAQEIRNGGPSNPGLPMTRAEKFDDEKRRIIQTCFGKKDADGSSMLYQYLDTMSPRIASVVAENLFMA